MTRTIFKTYDQSSARESLVERRTTVVVFPGSDSNTMRFSIIIPGYSFSESKQKFPGLQFVSSETVDSYAIETFEVSMTEKELIAKL